MTLKPLLLLAKEATNWTNDQLGDLVGMPRSTVQAVVSGRIAETLTPEQRRLLGDEVAGFLQDGWDALAELEMRS